MFKKNNVKSIRINEIHKQIELNSKITVCQFEELLNLNFEIIFQYDGKTYEVIQNGMFIELHNDCFYENGKTKSVSFSKYLSSKEFMENAEIQGKSFVEVISQIKILHC